MAQEKIPEVNKSQDLNEQYKPMIPYAANILLQSLMGLPVNDDRLKTAKFTLGQAKSSQVLAKEQQRVTLQERRFNFDIINTYGDEEQKKKIKALVKDSFPKMKFIDK